MQYRRVFEPGSSYFLTFVTNGRARIFTTSEVVEKFHSATRKVQSGRPFTIEAEVILPDHIHALWSLPNGDADYPTRVRLVKSYFTRSIGLHQTTFEQSASRASKAERPIWQRRYWEHTIRDDRDFNIHLDYIHFNPVKHGLVAAARDWPYSTFHDWVARGVYGDEWGLKESPQPPTWVGRE